MMKARKRMFTLPSRPKAFVSSGALKPSATSFLNITLSIAR
jgi:hypothetical protein